MKLEDVLNTLTTKDKILIYEMWQDDVETYVDIFFEGENWLDIRLNKKLLQRDVLILSVYMNTLYIGLDGVEDEA